MGMKRNGLFTGLLLVFLASWLTPTASARFAGEDKKDREEKEEKKESPPPSKRERGGGKGRAEEKGKGNAPEEYVYKLPDEKQLLALRQKANECLEKKGDDGKRLIKHYEESFFKKLPKKIDA